MLFRHLRHTAACLAVSLLLLPAALAQPGPPHPPAPAQPGPMPGAPDLARGVAVLKGLNEAELGKTFDKYATTAGAWYLEQRCKPFASDLRREFEWIVAQMTVMMGQVAKREFLHSLQQAGRQTAANYPCSEDTTSKLIVPAFADAKTTVKMLTGAEYSPAVQLMHDAQRTAVLLQGQAIDDQCKYMPPDIRAQYDENVRQITDRLTSRSADMMASLRTDVRRALERQPVTCDPAARQRLMMAYSESVAMLRQ